MKYDIPGYDKSLSLDTLILDLNGTLTIDGKIINGVKTRIQSLQKAGRNIVLCSGDTQGTAKTIAQQLGIELVVTKNGGAKEAVAKQHKAKHCVTIGNGHIDVKLMKKCALSIAVIQAEGCYSKTMMTSDVICSHINDALDILIYPKRLIATLRK